MERHLCTLLICPSEERKEDEGQRGKGQGRKRKEDMNRMVTSLMILNSKLTVNLPPI
jgi:hypothetical protein